MLGRRSDQKTFFDEVVNERLSKNHFLKVNKLINWTPIEKKLEHLYDPSNRRPRYPSFVMSKTLLLGQWFNFFDRDLPKAIADRLSFQSFLGLPLSDPVPDDTTFCRFRQKLLEEDLLEFERLGILVRRDSFIDATIVQAQIRSPFKATKESNSVTFIGNDEGTKENGSKTTLTKKGKTYCNQIPTQGQP